MDADKQSTVANPIMALTLAMIYWARTIQRETQSAHYPVDTVKRMAFLRKVGLVNTVNAEEIKGYAPKVELLQFMRQMWQDLGGSTLLVKLSDFYKILCDYDLVCGDFSLYKGEIPEKNMREIESVVEAYEGGIMDDYATPISYRKHITVARKSNYAVDAIRLPFDNLGEFGFPTNKQSGDGVWVCNVKNSNTQISTLPFFIAAPRSQMEQIHLSYEEYNPYFTYTYDIGFDEHGAATRQLVNIQSNGKSILDPFVCSICKYGVIIHSMWGAEAEDATIKRYEQLRDTIIGNSKSLTV